MSEYITALNLVLNEVKPKSSSLLWQASKVLKFVKWHKQSYFTTRLKNLINFYLVKYQDSLQVGKEQGLKRCLKNLLSVPLLVKISHYQG